MTKRVYKTNKMWGLVCGGLLLLTAWMVNHAVPSPYILFHNTESLPLLPPMWLLGFLWFAGYFGVGWTLGIICSFECLSCELNVKRYKGGMLLILSQSLSIAWYLLLFGSNAFFISWLLLGVSVLVGILAGLAFLGLNKGGALILLAVQSGYVVLFILQIMVMLHI